MARYQTIGKNYKTVTCAQTGEEVTRRKSLAIDYPGDGRGKSPATACRRVKRELVPKPQPLVIKEHKLTTGDLEKGSNFNIKKVVKEATKPLSTKEKVQIKKLLQKKRDEITKPS